MNEPLPILVENSIQIAWDYLERTGELGDPEVASRVLFDAVEMMVLRGERRKLLLSNKAIDAYMRFKADESAQAITGPYRQLNPEDNNERQAIHEHVSVPLPSIQTKVAAQRHRTLAASGASK